MYKDDTLANVSHIVYIIICVYIYIYNYTYLVGNILGGIHGKPRDFVGCLNPPTFHRSQLA